MIRLIKRDAFKMELLHAIEQAQRSIQIAVAWFTDAAVLEAITKQALKGVRVEVIIADHPINTSETYSLDFSAFQAAGGRLFLWNEGLFHSKTTIIDEQHLFSGSANYTYNGFTQNQETTLWSDDAALVVTLIAEFKELLKQLEGEQGIIIQPLRYFYASEITRLYQLVKTLEVERAEAEKVIQHYEVLYAYHLKAIIQPLLNLRKQIAEQRHDLVQKPETFTRVQFAQEKINAFYTTTENIEVSFEQVEDVCLQTDLKKLYREAAKFCHPDNPAIAEEHKGIANQLFDAIKKAYDANDLVTLRMLIDEVKSGLPFQQFQAENYEFDSLRSLYEQQKKVYDTLMQQIDTIMEDSRYKLMKGGDLEQHFAALALRMEEEIRQLTDCLKRT